MKRKRERIGGVSIPDMLAADTHCWICTHMQFRAARSLCTNFLWAKYSIPLATWRPKPIRSLTVGFCDGEQRQAVKQQREENKITTCFVCEGRREKRRERDFFRQRALFSDRIKCRTSPCFIYGRTTRGSPSLGSIMPSRDRMLGWWKPFIMRPSLRNWSTSPRSVIPMDTKDRTTQKHLMRTRSDYTHIMNYTMNILLRDFTAQWVSWLLLSIRNPW